VEKLEFNPEYRLKLFF